MGIIDHILAPTLVCYLLFNIPPTLMEIYAYYHRGGLVMMDIHIDDTWNPFYMGYTDWWVYYKRYCDRPKTESAKAFYAYLDWSAGAWDKSAYLHRRVMAKGNNEVWKWKLYIYGPFRFNWRDAHNVQWNRGDDAAGYGFPIWGEGGEARARTEWQAAKDKGLDYRWHYQIKKRIAREQDAKRKALEAKAAAESVAAA